MTIPAIIIPGYFASATEYQSLQHHLNQNFNIPTIIVPLRKRHWVTTLGGRSVFPILQRIHETVTQAMQRHHCDRVNLVAHSAAGWISRIYLGDKPYRINANASTQQKSWQAHHFVSSLICLGTPHTSQERWTRRNLEFVNSHYPGAFYGDVHYVCLAGKAIYGKRSWGSWLAYNSYQLTCGEGGSWGDGITPIVSAHLAGATNLTLDGVQHSPRASGNWYGSPEIVSSWCHYLRS